MKISHMILLFLLVACSHDPYKKMSSDKLYRIASNLRERYRGESKILGKVEGVAGELIKRDEKDFRGYLLKSWVIKRKGYINEGTGYRVENIKESFIYLQKALALNPLGLDSYADAASLLVIINNFEKAKLLLDDYKVKVVARQDPYHLYRYQSEYSYFLYKQGKYDEALKEAGLCEQLSRTIHQKTSCIYIIANIYSQQKKINEVLANYSRILKYLPEDPWTLSNIAGVYIDFKNFDKAIEYASRALKRKDFGMAWGNLSWAYFFKGNEFLSKGDNAKAFEYFNKIDMTKVEIGLLENIAAVYSASSDEERFLKTVGYLLEKAPHSIKGNFFLGDYHYIKKNDFDKASAYYESAYNSFSLDINHERLNDIKAWVLLRLSTYYFYRKKNYEQSLSFINKMQPLVSPSSEPALLGQMYYHMGLAYHELGWTRKDLEYSKKALMAYQNALKYSPDLKKSVDPNVRNVIANIHNFSKKR